jgi:hypothetical protein
MAKSVAHERNKAAKTPHVRGDAPQHRGGDHIRKARGNKAGKGGITRADQRNQNSSAKS